MYRFTLRIAAAAASPLTLQEACSALRLEQGMDDAAVNSALEAATGYLEAAHGISCVAPGAGSSHEDYFDDWPNLSEGIRLRRSPVSSVEFVRYVDSANVENTFSDWTLRGGVIWLWHGKTWPTRILRTEGSSITVRYRAGYADAATIPAPIKQALRLLVHSYYFDRDGSKRDQAYRAVSALVVNYRP